MSNDQIRFENVTLKFNEKVILKNFNWSIAGGEKVKIEGPSGSGKTSLFRLILGFVSPQEGAIYFDGHQITKANIWQIRRSIGYVGQDLILGEGTVNEFLNDVLSYEANQKLKIQKTHIMKLMQKFSLNKDHFKEQISNLSGGERQRLAIIVALLLDRPVYLLDEITSALDEALKLQVVEHFMKMNKTILVVSHDQVWNRYNTRILTLGKSTATKAH